MSLQESGEMYLESIYVLLCERDNIRAVDVCEYMGYSKPSVSRALGILRKGGYVLADKNGYLTLTEEGREVAKKIYERHEQLTSFLESIGVSHDTAASDACKLEHVISDESFEAIKKYAEFKRD